jgi:hypothetical protein
VASPEVKEVASQLAKVSLIKEEDGHVIIDGGHAPGDKSLYRLVKRGKRLTLQNAEINRSWDLPFDFQKESVTARFDAANNLTIEIVKGSESLDEAVRSSRSLFLSRSSNSFFSSSQHHPY